VLGEGQMDARPRAIATREIDGAAVVAEALRADFTRLIAIFDWQADDASAGRDCRLAMARARVAAERGLKLSEELVRLLNNIRVVG
jgi:hypothetical protein